MIGKVKVFFALLVLRPRLLFIYLMDSIGKEKNREQINSYLNNKLAISINRAITDVDYYQKYTKLKNDDVSDKLRFINSFKIINKNELKKNSNKIKNKKFKGKKRELSSGGSTGQPLKYYISHVSDEYSGYILYRGLKRGGWRLGDKIAVFAGGSLVKAEKSIKERLALFLFNQKKYSSFGVNDEDLIIIIKELNEWRPNIIRGYASSIEFLAKYVIDSKIEIKFQLKSIFTTSEMLTSTARDVIEKAFNCKVHNSYGLNDGGITAFECRYGSMHIDYQRSYLEVVNEKDELVFDEVGRIVATTLVDEYFPLIRYDTGDLGQISTEICSCGDESYILKSINGRATDYLEFNGMKIGSPVLTVLMGNVECEKYQIIQNGNTITFNIKVDDIEGFEKQYCEYINESLTSHLGDISVKFIYNNEFILTGAGKHKFIVKNHEE